MITRFNILKHLLLSFFTLVGAIAYCEIGTLIPKSGGKFPKNETFVGKFTLFSHTPITHCTLL